MSDKPTTPTEPPPITGRESRLTPLQLKQLIQPVNPVRVKPDPLGFAYLPQHDVKAHLIRVFGFCGFDTEIKACELVYDEAKANSDGKPNGRWDACYRVIGRLIVKAPDGTELAHYEDGATGDSTNQKSRAKAHDLALKDALSGAIKRAAVSLGDQFGLSLYNKGQLTSYVIRTLFEGESATQDVQEGVSKPLSDGIDEGRGGDEVDMDEGQQAAAAKTLGHTPIPKTVPKAATA